ncbi:F-box/LRR-repeat protein 3-like [Vicia villosa]|uniref:F-box/LRR-repeat protein 3-like n=1 Tax=Vicia villosa TaxID=3911 RepID=UPI00273B7584|nr:F-box/LRR-repeat protein 3-like [Vicia villosa]
MKRKKTKKNTSIRSSKPLAIRKKKRTYVKSSQQQQQPFSSTNSIIIAEAEFEFYLPDECWERVFTFIINPPDLFLDVFPFPTDPVDDKIKEKYKRNFESLSLVSKHFLSITNRLIFSLKIYYPQLCHLSRFFHRFSNLNSLDICFGSYYLDADIALALRDRSSLKSLSIYMFEINVTSHYIDSLLSLKGLNSLKFHSSQISDYLLYSIARQGLPLNTFVLENCTGYTYHGIYDLLSKCRGIRHLGLQGVDFLNNHYVSQLSLLLSDLVSINLSKCSKLTESTLFTLSKNCHSLGEITMQSLYIDDFDIERENVENYDILKDFDVNPQLKFLHLFRSSFINDETIILFASFSNLKHLDLSCCHNISEKGIRQVLNSCCKLRDLMLMNCKVRGLKLNFVVPQLEVLDLSRTSVDDKTLHEISKSCCGLLELLLICCEYVTKKGVKRVVENCKQCRVIQ